MSITVERYGRYQLPFRGRHFLFQRSLTILVHSLFVSRRQVSQSRVTLHQLDAACFSPMQRSFRLVQPHCCDRMT